MDVLEYLPCRTMANIETVLCMSVQWDNRVQVGGQEYFTLFVRQVVMESKFSFLFRVAA